MVTHSVIKNDRNNYNNREMERRSFNEYIIIIFSITKNEKYYYSYYFYCNLSKNMKKLFSDAVIIYTKIIIYKLHVLHNTKIYINIYITVK